MIGEPRKDEKKIVGHQVATEKDEDNKNKLKITTATSLCKGSTKTTTLQQEKNEVEKSDRPILKFLGSTLIVQQLWKHVLRTFRLDHPEIGMWKFNMSKNIWKVVRNHCSFDKLMDKYKTEYDLSPWTNTNSMNRPLKIRVFTSQAI